MESKVIKRETLTKENEFKIEKDDLNRKVKRKKSNPETLEEDLKKIMKDTTTLEKKDQTMNRIPKKKETKKLEQEEFLIDQNVKMENKNSPSNVDHPETRKTETLLNFKIPKIKRENQNDSQETPPPPSKQQYINSPSSKKSSPERRNRSKSPDYKRQRNYSPHSNSPKSRNRKKSSTPERSKTPERPKYSGGYRRKDYREQQRNSNSPRSMRKRRNYSHSPPNSSSFEKKKEKTLEIDTKEKWREHIKKIKENCQTSSLEEVYGGFSGFIYQYGSFLKPYSQDPTNFLIEEVYTKEISDHSLVKTNSPNNVGSRQPPTAPQNEIMDEKKELKKKMYEMISELSRKYFENFPKEELKLICKKLTQKIAEKETMDSFEKVETQKKIKTYVEKYLEEKIKK
jgi:hypothetical protein